MSLRRQFFAGSLAAGPQVGRTPHPHSTQFIAASRPHPVIRQRDRGHARLMPEERRVLLQEFSFGRPLPDDHLPVVARRQQRRSIRRPRAPPHIPAMPAQHLLRRAAFDIPHPRRRVVRGRNQFISLGRELDRQNMVLMPGQFTHQLSRRHIPHPDRRIVARRRQSFPCRIDRHRRHRMPMHHLTHHLQIGQRDHPHLAIPTAHHPQVSLARDRRGR